MRLPEFVLGSLLVRGEGYRWMARQPQCLSALSALIIVATAESRNLSRPMLESVVLILSSAMVVRAAEYRQQRGHSDFAAGLLSTRPPVTLGNISYEIYILQYPIGLLIFAVVTPSMMSFGIYVTCLVCLATLMNSGTERLNLLMRSALKVSAAHAGPLGPHL
jgi:peptidoglycan/LPS O-acetylase OafA/YrhL